MIVFELEHEGHPIDKIRGIREGVKEGLEAAVEYWHKHFAHYHFRREAFTRYAGVYAQRDHKYNRRKRRRYGHANPLWLTGASRRAILRFIRITSRVNGQERVALGDVFPPSYFWKGVVVPSAHKRTRLATELFTTTPEEERVLYGVVMKYLQRHLDRANRKKRRERIA